ncbi:S9 family peptidase [Catalinimonas niigatensis]|uniref:S9 family peptidase n=1 Tax=Catalinimonas niigatensis TaxID=1397264 RepID=UPI002AA2B215|nr:DPP IV N-terminal domain-containing protein [Catalinimonas niigatensis]WPP53454.1 DPP IV N-terminal domain-containing protein [Catalinimonas niigatensis]
MTCIIVAAQEKQSLTLEDIFENDIFFQYDISNIKWMKDGRHYTSVIPDDTAYYEHILRYAASSGEMVDTLVNGAKLIPGEEPYALVFNDYHLSPNEKLVLFATEQEPIYRRSKRAYYYLYDIDKDSFQSLAGGGKQSYATFSPDGNKVAFVRDNNLFYVTLDDMHVQKVTEDGIFNKLIHGSADWVYEEEFSFAKAFFWSPDSEKLAFLSFDESAVKEYNMQLWNEVYPEDYRFKYPKAGEQNSVVNLSVYHLAEDKKIKVDVGDETDMYIPRVEWTQNPDVLSFIRMNRLQNQMELVHAHASSGESKVVLKETADTYVDIEFNDNLAYLEDDKHFIMSSERSGFKHLYLYTMAGEIVRQITEGNWEVSELLGVDEQRSLVYYTSTEVSPLERHLYSIDFKGKKKRKLSEEPGTYDANFSPTHQFYIRKYSSAHTPRQVSLHEAPSGKLIRVLEENKELQETVQKYQLGSKEFFTFRNTEDTLLYGYMIKPADFNPSREYPVLMYVYGGPGSQLVQDSWMSDRDLWHHYLTQQGYIVACIDNRGTGGRGKNFKHATYGQLGKYEVQDQIDGARYLSKLPFVDPDRVGIWGWSYGGYMSSLALFVGNGVFKTAIAVAPVTNWRFYDTIYTERFLQTPQLNPEGYDAYSPLSHADKLEGNFLLIHGTGDDNVHVQNSLMLQDALISAGKQFDSFFYPNRNHGIYGGNTRLHLFRMMTSFLEDKL